MLNWIQIQKACARTLLIVASCPSQGRVWSIRLVTEENRCLVAGRVLPGRIQLLLWQRRPYSLGIWVQEHRELAPPVTEAEIYLYDFGWPWE